MLAVTGISGQTQLTLSPCHPIHEQSLVFKYMFYLPAYERLSTCALAFMNHSKEILYMVFAILLKKEICIINKIILNLIINFTRSLYHVFHRKLVNEFHTCIYQHDLGYFPDNLPVIWDKCSCGQVTSYKILK